MEFSGKIKKTEGTGLFSVPSVFSVKADNGEIFLASAGQLFVDSVFQPAALFCHGIRDREIEDELCLLCSPHHAEIVHGHGDRDCG